MCFPLPFGPIFMIISANFALKSFRLVSYSRQKCDWMSKWHLDPHQENVFPLHFGPIFIIYKICIEIFQIKILTFSWWLKSTLTLSNYFVQTDPEGSFHCINSYRLNWFFPIIYKSFYFWSIHVIISGTVWFGKSLVEPDLYCNRPLYYYFISQLILVYLFAAVTLGIFLCVVHSDDTGRFPGCAPPPPSGPV